MIAQTRIASALSTAPDLRTAVREAAGRVAEDLRAPDLAVVFFSPHHVDEIETASAMVRELLLPGHLLGCTGESVVGDGQEIESEPAVAIWAASFASARIEVFRSELVRAPQGAGFTGIPDLASRDDARAVLLLGDPYTYPAHVLLEHASERFGGLPFIGGMASGGMGAGQHRLLLDGDVHNDGAVGVVISGDVRVRTVVSQGCRPVGSPLVVTRSDGNIIHELGGRPALERAQAMLADLDPRDRELASRGLHIGIVIDEYREEFGRGDFLVRGVIGGDPETGSIAVGDEVEVGRTVQFHVRDADTADEDLRELLERLESPAAGALLFTCNGRGSRLFTGPDHDVQAIHKALGTIPVAGFFCAGEIGPIGGRNFLHGFTASAAFFD